MSCDFRRGDVIMVKSKLDSWFFCKRVFLQYIDIKGVANPYICVHEDDEAAYLKGEPFRVVAWEEGMEFRTELTLMATPHTVTNVDKEKKI